MTSEAASPFSLTTRPCLVDVGRFRWDLYSHESLFQSSAESFDTEEEAHASGMTRVGAGSYLRRNLPDGPEIRGRAQVSHGSRRLILLRADVYWPALFADNGPAFS